MCLADDRSELVEQNHVVMQREGSRRLQHCAQNVTTRQVPECKDKWQNFTVIDENLSTYKHLQP